MKRRCLAMSSIDNRTYRCRNVMGSNKLCSKHMKIKQNGGIFPVCLDVIDCDLTKNILSIVPGLSTVVDIFTP